MKQPWLSIQIMVNILAIKKNDFLDKIYNMLAKTFGILAVIAGILWIAFWTIGTMNPIFGWLLAIPMIAAAWGCGIFIILAIVFLALGR